MAGDFGGLVVTLALNAVGWTSGLTKAEMDARKFKENVNSSLLQIGKVLGGLGLGKLFLDATKEIISSAGALQDLAGSTGSSVESLSKLANQAQVSGASFEQLQTALFKLEAGMGGLDNDSNKVINALKTLGISAKDPVDALNQVALTFNKFADGARKAAFAREIFGKTGPEFLRVLKDIAETQDIAATTTTKQAVEAEKLEKGFRLLAVRITELKNAVLTDLVPALNDLVGAFSDAIKGAGSLGKALADLATAGIGEETGESLKRLRGELEKLEELKKAGGKDFLGVFVANDKENLEANIQQLKRAIEIKKSAERRAANALIDPSNNDVRDIIAQRKPELPALPDPKARGREAKKLLDQQIKELEAFIASERDVLGAREDFLRTYYQDDQISLRDFFAGRKNALDEAFTNEAAAFDKEIQILKDFAKKAKPEDRIDAETKIADAIAKRAKLQQETANKGASLFLEEARAVRQFTESIEQASIALQEMQGDSVGAAGAAFDFANRRMTRQLAALRASSNPEDQQLGAFGQGVIDETRRLIVVRTQLNKVTQDYSLTIDELGIAQARIDIGQSTGDLTTLGALRAKSELAAKYTVILREQLAVLELVAAQTGKREDLVRVEQLKVQLEQLAATGDLVAKQFNEIFAGAFTTALTEAVSGTKSLKDSFLDMAKSIEQAITRIAAQNIAEKIFGGKGAGSGIGDVLSKIFGLFSGGAGGIGGGAFIPPGGGLAGGTPSWRGGLTVVGERGPEVVNLPRGASVTSNRDSQKLFGPTMNFSINVLPGASTQTAAQAASQTGIAVRRAMARNT